MNGDDHEERRKLIHVSDRPMEIQGILQTVFTFLMLGVMSWVGLTLEKVKDNTAQNFTQIALQNQRTNNVERRLDESNARMQEKIDAHINSLKAHK